MTRDAAKPDLLGSFEDWAALSARLQRRSETEYAEVLGALGLAAAWEPANRVWGGAIAGELVQGRLDKARRYAALCARELSRRRAGTAASDLETTMPERDLSGSAAPPFREQLGQARAVQAPAPDQQRTVISTTAAPAREQMLAAELALGWTVEQYAYYQAELAASADPEAVHNRYGLLREHTRRHVAMGWQQRLQANQELKARFDEAFERARQATGG